MCRVVAPSAGEVGVALEHLAGVAILDKPLGQAEAAEATARDQYVERSVLDHLQPPSPPGRDPGHARPRYADKTVRERLAHPSMKVQFAG
jgi:hypothetical protein